MKKLITLKVEKHTEQWQEYFVATSDDVQGLVAEGETLEQTIELAYDVAKELLKAQQKNSKTWFLQQIPEIFSYSLLVEA